MLVCWSGTLSAFGSLTAAAVGVAAAFGSCVEGSADVGRDVFHLHRCRRQIIFRLLAASDRRLGNEHGGSRRFTSSLLSVFLSSVCDASFTAVASSVLAGVGSFFFGSSLATSFASFALSSFTVDGGRWRLGGQLRSDRRSAGFATGLSVVRGHDVGRTRDGARIGGDRCVLRGRLGPSARDRVELGRRLLRRLASAGLRPAVRRGVVHAAAAGCQQSRSEQTLRSQLKFSGHDSFPCQSGIQEPTARRPRTRRANRAACSSKTAGVGKEHFTTGVAANRPIRYRTLACLRRLFLAKADKDCLPCSSLGSCLRSGSYQPQFAAYRRGDQHASRSTATSITPGEPSTLVEALIGVGLLAAYVLLVRRVRTRRPVGSVSRPTRAARTQGSVVGKPRLTHDWRHVAS